MAAYRSRNLNPAALLRRMPVDETRWCCMWISRRCGSAGMLQLLDGSKVAEEPEYQAFVRKTDFDYRQDLDAALVAFAPGGKYLLLKGRFDWRSLRAYVDEPGGPLLQRLVPDGRQHAGAPHFVLSRCNPT